MTIVTASTGIREAARPGTPFLAAKLTRTIAVIPSASAPRFLFLLLIACILAACGGGGGSSDALSLSGLSASPNGSYAGGTPGTVTVQGSVTVSGSNAKTIRVSLVDASGRTVAAGVGPISGISSAGPVSFSATFAIASLAAGDYQLAVQIAPGSGDYSDPVTRPFKLLAYPWTSSTAMPSPLSQFALAAVGTKIYVMTGLATSNGLEAPSAQVFIYDTATGGWSSGPLAPTPRAGATAAAVGGRIYLMGGYNSDFPAGLNTVEVFDTQTGSWSAGPSAPTARFASCAVTIDSSIYLANGTRSQSAASTLDTLEKLDTSTGTWTSLAGNKTTVAHPGCTALNGQIYLTGGETSPKDFSELIGAQRYDPAANSWSDISFFSINRSRHAALAVGGQVLIFGGRSDSGGVEAPTRITEAFVPAENAWHNKAPMPTATQDTGAALIGNTVYLIAPTSTYLYQAQSDAL